MGCLRGSRVVESVSAGGNPVQVELPHQQIAAACFHHGVFHMQVAREFRDRLPAHIGMFDIGLFVQFEEIELSIVEAEKLAPALSFETEPTRFAHRPFVFRDW